MTFARPAPRLPPESVVLTLALFDSVGSNGADYSKLALTGLNDGGIWRDRHTFKEIAAIIRQNPHHYFKEPK